jgi:hypothetical protein
MPKLLVGVAEPIVVPVTALLGPAAGEPREDTFAPEPFGRVFVTSLRIRAQAGPGTAEDIARAVIGSPRSSSPRTTRTSPTPCAS